MQDGLPAGQTRIIIDVSKSLDSKLQVGCWTLQHNCGIEWKALNSLDLFINLIFVHG
jgi:hypothetical protein